MCVCLCVKDTGCGELVLTLMCVTFCFNLLRDQSLRLMMESFSLSFLLHNLCVCCFV